jgi:Protein of unknown function (DUF2628).
MASFIILSRSEVPGPDAGATIVADRFSWPAFLLTIPWLLWHRIWFAAVPMILFAVLSGWLGTEPRHALLATLVSLLVQLYAGFEGNAWRVEALVRRGFRIVDVIEAPDAETAFARHAFRASPAAPVTAPPPPIHSRPALSAPVSAAGLAGLGREA